MPGKPITESGLDELGRLATCGDLGPWVVLLSRDKRLAVAAAQLAIAYQSA